MAFSTFSTISTFVSCTAGEWIGAAGGGVQFGGSRLEGAPGLLVKRMMADRLEPVDLIYHPDSIRADGTRGWGLHVVVLERERVVEDG